MTSIANAIHRISGFAPMSPLMDQVTSVPAVAATSVSAPVERLSYSGKCNS